MERSPALDASARSVLFDFRRLDRVPNSQLGALRFLHEDFVRNLSASLSVYLRSYVSGTLVGIKQLQYAEFADSLPAPTCMVYYAMRPYEGHCVAEVNQSLLAPILDLVLGGSGKIKTELNREITDVEENLLEGLFRIMAHDLAETWKPVVPIDFVLDAVETKPQLSKRIARSESVIAITIELRISETAGTLNLAIPSLTLKPLRQRFDQQWAVNKPGGRDTEQAIKERLARKLFLDLDCELHGARIRLRDLLALEVGNVIDLGVDTDTAKTVLVGGKPKFKGRLMAKGQKVAVAIDSPEVRA